MGVCLRRSGGYIVIIPPLCSSEGYIQFTEYGAAIEEPFGQTSIVWKTSCPHTTPGPAGALPGSRASAGCGAHVRLTNAAKTYGCFITIPTVFPEYICVRLLHDERETQMFGDLGREPISLQPVEGIQTPEVIHMRFGVAK